MRLRIVAEILVVGVAATGLIVVFGPRVLEWAMPPAKRVAERFWATEPPRAAPPALEEHATKRRLDAKVAFDPDFIAAPRSEPPKTPNLKDLRGSLLAFGPPVSPPEVLNPPPPPPSEPLKIVPTPPERPDQGRGFVPDLRVFNDAQIASLKRRLRLTPAQEALWPPVEAELRELAWHRTGNTQRLDIGTLQRLKEASDKLLAALREDQKREVRLLMGMVGFKAP